MQSANSGLVNDMVGVQDILNLLRIRKMLILYWIAAGIFATSAYLILTPKVYESTAMVRMAQYYSAEGIYQYTEEPSAAAERLGMPEMQTIEIRKACGFSENEELDKNINGTLKAAPISSIAGGLELRVRGRGQERPRICAEALVKELHRQQKFIIEYRLKGNQQLISSYEQEMQKTKNQLEKLSNNSAGFAYLSNVNRLNWLEARIANLKNADLMSQTYPTSLITPIITKNKPVSPKVLLSLLFGLIISFMLGMVHALIKELQTRRSNEIRNFDSEI